MTGWPAILALVAWMVAAPASRAMAQTTRDDILSLRGLPGVAVRVFGLPDRSTDPAVVTTGEIQPEVEAQLRQAGIRLLSAAEADAMASRPYVHIDFTFARTPAGIRFYLVVITLRQSAVLTTGQALSVRTLEDSAGDWAEPADYRTRLHASVKDAVGRFTNAWAIANRK